MGHGKDKAGKARSPVRQGRIEGSRCTRKTRVRYPWEAVRADQPSAPSGSSSKAEIERVMANLGMEKDRDGGAALRDRSRQRQLMALAGLRKSWRSPAGEWMRSFAIITIERHELCAELHNR